MTDLLRQALQGQNIPEERSAENILDNLVTITYKEKKRRQEGSGLLLSENGLLLTAYHVIHPVNDRLDDTWREELRHSTIEHGGQTYHLDPSIVRISIRNDLAVLKVRKPGVARVIPYRIATEHRVGDAITLHAMLDGRDYHQYGKITHYKDTTIEGQSYEQAIYTDAYSRPGFSGGVMLRDGALLGVNQFSVRDGTLGRAAGSHIHHALRLAR